MLGDVEIEVCPDLMQDAVALVRLAVEVNVNVAAFPVLRDRVVAAQPEPFEQQHAEPLFGEPRCEF